jgi:hypothetical protein
VKTPIADADSPRLRYSPLETWRHIDRAVDRSELQPTSPPHSPTSETGDDARAQRRGGISVPRGSFDTTEIRWLGYSALPTRWTDWFTDHGTLGETEIRTDAYHLDGTADYGLKLRAGATLDAKTRHSMHRVVSLAGGLTGRIEEWSKWRRDGDALDEGATWLPVRKQVITRM